MKTLFNFFFFAILMLAILPSDAKASIKVSEKAYLDVAAKIEYKTIDELKNGRAASHATFSQGFLLTLTGFIYRPDFLVYEIAGGLKSEQDRGEGKRTRSDISLGLHFFQQTKSPISLLLKSSPVSYANSEGDLISKNNSFFKLSGIYGFSLSKRLKYKLSFQRSDVQENSLSLGYSSSSKKHHFDLNYLFLSRKQGRDDERSGNNEYINETQHAHAIDLSFDRILPRADISATAYIYKSNVMSFADVRASLFDRSDKRILENKQVYINVFQAEENKPVLSMAFFESLSFNARNDLALTLNYRLSGYISEQQKELSGDISGGYIKITPIVLPLIRDFSISDTLNVSLGFKNSEMTTILSKGFTAFKDIQLIGQRITIGNIFSASKSFGTTNKSPNKYFSLFFDSSNHYFQNITPKIEAGYIKDGQESKQYYGGSVSGRFNLYKNVRLSGSATLKQTHIQSNQEDITGKSAFKSVNVGISMASKGLMLHASVNLFEYGFKSNAFNKNTSNVSLLAVASYKRKQSSLDLRIDHNSINQYPATNPNQSTTIKISLTRFW